MYLGHFPTPRRAWDAVFISFNFGEPDLEASSLVMRANDMETPGVEFTQLR